jgi:hypothetical protein
MTNERLRKRSARPSEARKVLVRFQVSRPCWGVGQLVGQRCSCQNPGVTLEHASNSPCFGFEAEPLKLSTYRFESGLPCQNLEDDQTALGSGVIGNARGSEPRVPGSSPGFPSIHARRSFWSRRPTVHDA